MRANNRELALQVTSEKITNRHLTNDLNNSNDVIDHLNSKIDQSHDITVHLLREQLADTERRLHETEYQLTQALLVAAPQQSPSNPASLDYQSIRIPRALYSPLLLSIGFLEAVFTQYADYTDMTTAMRRAWITDGRISGRFFMICMDAIKPVFTWKKQHLTAVDHGSMADLFFWKIEAFRMTVDLSALLQANTQMITGRQKSHLKAIQVATATQHYTETRQRFTAMFESASEGYLKEYTRWPPMNEYSKVVPLDWACDDSKPISEVEAAIAAIDEIAQGGVLVDHVNGTDHVFANDDTAVTFKTLVKKRRKH